MCKIERLFQLSSKSNLSDPRIHLYSKMNSGMGSFCTNTKLCIFTLIDMRHSLWVALGTCTNIKSLYFQVQRNEILHTRVGRSKAHIYSWCQLLHFLKFHFNEMWMELPYLIKIITLKIF